MSSDTQHPETLALHAGWRADPATGAVAVSNAEKGTTWSASWHRCSIATGLLGTGVSPAKIAEILSMRSLRMRSES